MKLVCIGDSLTYGYGVYSEKCWVELLGKNLNIEVINKGVNGDTTAGILSRSSKDILQLKPSHVIIMAGTNDLLLNYPLNNIIDNIKFILEEIKINNIIPILALQPPIVNDLAIKHWDKYIDYKTVNENLLEYIKILQTFACKNNIDFINFYDYFIKTKDIINLYSDGIHPNSLGHKLMFKFIIKSKVISY